jgi:hypothetical protein
MNWFAGLIALVVLAGIVVVFGVTTFLFSLADSEQNHWYGVAGIAWIAAVIFFIVSWATAQ